MESYDAPQQSTESDLETGRTNMRENEVLEDAEEKASVLAGVQEGQVGLGLRDVDVTIPGSLIEDDRGLVVRFERR